MRATSTVQNRPTTAYQPFVQRVFSVVRACHRGSRPSSSVGAPQVVVARVFPDHAHIDMPGCVVHRQWSDVFADEQREQLHLMS